MRCARVGEPRRGEVASEPLGEKLLCSSPARDTRRPSGEMEDVEVRGVWAVRAGVRTSGFGRQGRVGEVAEAAVVKRVTSREWVERRGTAELRRVRSLTAASDG